jgi:hypothetical protein
MTTAEKISIVQQTKEATGSQGIGAVATKFTTENKSYASIPEAQRLVLKINELGPALDEFLEAVKERINAYSFNTGPLFKIAGKLIKVRAIMAELVSAQGDMDGLSEEHQAVLIKLRREINQFVLPLLAENSLVKQTIEVIPIPFSLLGALGSEALAKSGLKNVTSENDLKILLDVMLVELLTEIPNPTPDADIAKENTQIAEYRKNIGNKKIDGTELPARADKTPLHTLTKTAPSAPSAPLAATSNAKKTPEDRFEELCTEINDLLPAPVVSNYSWNLLSSPDPLVKLKQDFNITNNTSYFSQDQKLGIFKKTFENAKTANSDNETLQSKCDNIIQKIESEQSERQRKSGLFNAILSDVANKMNKYQPHAWSSEININTVNKINNLITTLKHDKTLTMDQKLAIVAKYINTELPAAQARHTGRFTKSQLVTHLQDAQQYINASCADQFKIKQDDKTAFAIDDANYNQFTQNLVTKGPKAKPSFFGK